MALAVCFTASIQIGGNSQTALAQMRLCDTHTLTGSDAGAARHVIRRTAAGRAIDWSSAWTCVYRGRGTTWVGLAAEPQADGSVVEPRVSCQRNRLLWKCELWQNRHYVVTLKVGDIPRTIKVGLPPAFDVKEVVPLLLRAIEAAASPAANRECGQPPPFPPNKRETEWTEALNKSLRFEGPDAYASISEEPGKVLVNVDGNVLEFIRSAAEPAGFEFQCWYMVVIVT